jgi:hypothetical protein
MGDKTQIAVITMSASSKKNRFRFFLGGAIALVLLTGIAGLAGEEARRAVPAATLSKVAAVLFVTIGFGPGSKTESLQESAVAFRWDGSSEPPGTKARSARFRFRLRLRVDILPGHEC